MSESMDAVFEALASPARRRILDIVKNDPGCSVKEVAGHFEISRIAVMKHLGVLEGAGLIVSEKTGRTRRLYLNPVPIQMIYDRWTSEFSALWAGKLTRLKYRVEGESGKAAKWQSGKVKSEREGGTRTRGEAGGKGPERKKGDG
jgi:DNA-binding transcriptional ArsR family regulator